MCRIGRCQPPVKLANVALCSWYTTNVKTFCVWSHLLPDIYAAKNATSKRPKQRAFSTAAWPENTTIMLAGKLASGLGDAVDLQTCLHRCLRLLSLPVFLKLVLNPAMRSKCLGNLGKVSMTPEACKAERTRHLNVATAPRSFLHCFIMCQLIHQQAHDLHYDHGRPGCFPASSAETPFLPITLRR